MWVCARRGWSQGSHCLVPEVATNLLQVIGRYSAPLEAKLTPTISKAPRAILSRGVSLVAAVMLLAAVPRVAAATPIPVSVIPSLTSVTAGQSFSVDITITSVTDLFAYQFDLLFDPTVLQATNVLDGGFLTSGGGASLFGGPFAVVFDNSLGILTILDLLTGPAPPASGVTGTGTVVTIQFDAGGSGMPSLTNLVLSGLILEDSTGAFISGQGFGASVDVTAPTGGGTPVPEPATFLLVGLGAAVAFAKARRLRSSS